MSLHRIAILAGCVLFAAGSPASACGFIESSGNITTLRELDAESDVILVGHLENARGTEEDGSTELVITKTIKAHAAVAGKKVTISRLLPIPDPKKPPVLLIFGEVRNGKTDFFRGFAATPALTQYAEGIFKIDAEDRVKLMRYAFDFLEHKEPDIAADAFGVFIKSTDPDISKAAKQLAPEKLRKWLVAEGTKSERLRLYAFLLANCGNRDDAKLFREVLDTILKQDAPTLFDGVLTAYTLLDPKAGWEYTCDLLKTDSRFMVHLSGLRAARYFRTTQPEVLPEKDLLRVVGLMLEQSDVADLAIEELRRWKCWRLTRQILALTSRKGFDQPIIRRSILKYALQCPDADAAAFVAEQRKANPERVNEVAERLKEEEKYTRP